MQNLDYAETFLSIAGVDVPDDMQGHSLVPLLRGESPDDWRNSIYYHYYEAGGEHRVPAHEGVRDERYKLINFYRDDGVNLFDLKTDPTEMKNVAGDKDYQDILAAMHKKLVTKRKQYDLPPLPKRKTP